MTDEQFKFIDETSDRKYFTIVPNYVLNHSTAIDRALYIDIKRAAGDNGVCFMTEQTMCRKLGIGEKKLHKSLKYLLDHDWIKEAGTVPAKTRPIKAYKIVDIWAQNSDFYKDKKIPVKSGVSQKLPKSQKDTRQKQDMIPARSSVEEEPLLRRLNTNSEPNGSGIKGIKSMKELLAQRKIAAPKTKGGATYKWQDDAVRWWQKLGYKGIPATSWFRLFKLNAVIAERACSWASDSGARNLEKLVYWAFAQFRKNGKIVYDKAKVASQF